MIIFWESATTLSSPYFSQLISLLPLQGDNTKSPMGVCRSPGVVGQGSGREGTMSVGLFVTKISPV